LLKQSSLSSLLKLLGPELLFLKHSRRGSTTPSRLDHGETRERDRSHVTDPTTKAFEHVHEGHEVILSVLRTEANLAQDTTDQTRVGLHGGLWHVLWSHAVALLKLLVDE